MKKRILGLPLILTIAALIVVVSVSVIYTEGDGEVQGEPGISESTQGLDSDVVKQLPMSNAADEIYRLWQSAGYQDFAGISFDNESWTVVLYWKDGTLPTQMDTLVTELRETVPIRVVNTTYSLEEMQTESKRLLGLGTMDGVDVNEAGPNGDFSAIKVGIDMSGDLTPEQKIEAAKQVITSTYPLEFKVTRELVPNRSRWDDSEPFYGGAAIDHSLGWGDYFYCSTGFAVTTDSDEEGMLTAAHCHYGWDYNTPEGDLYVGTVSNPSSCTNDASTLLDETYSPRVYVGDWEGSSSVSVAGWEYPTVGQYLYVSGGLSGEHRVRVESTLLRRCNSLNLAVRPIKAIDETGHRSAWRFN